MKIELYHLYRRFSLINLAYPIVLDTLKTWAESAGWQARAFVCKESAVDITSGASVVGFSVYTQTANATYRVAEKLRAAGKIVILGGPHFRGPQTFAEAVPYCDVLVSSICERQWKTVLGAISNGKIVPNMQRPVLVIDKENRFKYSSLSCQSYSDKKWFQFPCIPTSLGCPYACEFCSPFMPGEYVMRDVETIYNEVAHAHGRYMWLCDATFGLNKRHTKELMKAIAPLKKRICVETTIARVQDLELIPHLASGGVRWITLGVETPTAKLKKQGSGNMVANLRNIIRCAHDNGIIVQGNFMCGLDSDGLDVFDRIYDCYQKSRIDSAMVNILVPYPNTVLGKRMVAEGRITDTNWEHYDNRHVVYLPKQMTAEQLVNGYVQLTHNIYNVKQVMLDSLAVLKNKGAWSTIAIGHKMSFLYDHLRKERALRSGVKAQEQSGKGTK
jgi:radical SAM superfamily enzyme YgiQ (UPF0313 family)